MAPEPDRIEAGARLLRASGLVAFPTETVYGLGANALDPQAVAGIFRAKGRPSNNPLIVHITSMGQARELAEYWPTEADLLAAHFWPGPLSIVVRKSSSIPNIVSADKPTVALRAPNHAVALALINQSGLPIAAPSANRSEQLSPTTAQHVMKSLYGRIPLILDGGPTGFGIESTVIALTDSGPRVLRPGAITPAELEAVIGPVQRPQAGGADVSSLASPGLMLRHYAPEALLIVTETGFDAVSELAASGEFVGWLRLEGLAEHRVRDLEPDNNASAAKAPIVLTMPTTSLEYAQLLYARLHYLDGCGVTRIVVDRVPDAEEWLGIADRLNRAAHRTKDQSRIRRVP